MQYEYVHHFYGSTKLTIFCLSGYYKVYCGRYEKFFYSMDQVLDPEYVRVTAIDYISSYQEPTEYELKLLEGLRNNVHTHTEIERPFEYRYR